MTTTRRPSTLRAAIKANHLATVRRGELAAKDADRLAAALKAEIRRLVAEAKADAARVAAKRFGELAAQFAGDVQKLVRLQAERAWKDVQDALARVLKVPPLPPALLDAQIDRLVPQPTQPEKRHNALFVAGLLAFVTAGVTAAVIGTRGALGQPRKPLPPVGAEAAIDRLATVTKRRMRYGGLAVVNRATRAAVERALPVAKRAPQEPLPAGIPIPRRDRGPLGPFPGEPDLVILPAVPVTPVDPNLSPPTRDPSPISPIPPSSNLIGWQVLSVLIPTTRDKHRHRHKDVFFYNPREERGEMGMDRCPNPPYESPKDGGTLAYNCLCRIVPVFEGEEPE